MNEKINAGLEKILEENPGVKIIYLAYSGSTLYGTNTENSDLDIKGLFIPTKDSLLLGNAPTVLEFNSNKKAKNSNEDIDIELFSVSEFLRLLSKGETNSIDLLFSMFSPSVVLETELSLIFKEQYKNLLTKNIKSFIGFAMQQASLSSEKGNRLKEVEILFNELNKEVQNFEYKELKQKRLSNFRHIIHINTLDRDYISLYINESNEEELYVLGRKFILKTPIFLVMNSLESILKSYGARSHNTKINEGKDFKAISHALRAIEEGIELFETGFIKLPLQKAQEIKNIKIGLVADKEEIDNLLEDRISVLKKVAETTLLPEKININTNELLLEIYKKAL